MTSIRAQLDSHTPILTDRSDNEGFVFVEHADFQELAKIAGDLSNTGVLATTPTHVEIAASDFQKLVERAHEALHGPGIIPQSADPAAQRLLNAIFGDPEEFAPSQDYKGGEPEDDEETGVDRGYDEQNTVGEANYRSAAMAYAVQLVGTQINSAHGLDAPKPETVVPLAEAILGFLKG